MLVATLYVKPLVRNDIPQVLVRSMACLHVLQFWEWHGAFVVQGVSLKNGWLEYYFLIGEAYAREDLTAGTYKSPIWKGISSEPNLQGIMFHVNLPGCIFRGELLVSGRVTLFHNCCTPDWYCWSQYCKHFIFVQILWKGQEYISYVFGGFTTATSPTDLTHGFTSLGTFVISTDDSVGAINYDLHI